MVSFMHFSPNKLVVDVDFFTERLTEVEETEMENSPASYHL